MFSFCQLNYFISHLHDVFIYLLTYFDILFDFYVIMIEVYVLIDYEKNNIAKDVIEFVISRRRVWICNFLNV